MNLREEIMAKCMSRGVLRKRRNRRFNVVTIQNPVEKRAKQPKARSYTSASTSFNLREMNNTRDNVSETFASFDETNDDDSKVVLAITQGTGEATCEVGIAAINITRPSLIMCQISDTLSYTNILTKINIINPREILIPITTTSSRLSEKIKEHFKNAKILGIPRATFNSSNGFNYVKSMCAFNWNSIVLMVQYKYYALTAVSALFTYIENHLYTFYAPESMKMEYQESEGFMIIDVLTADKLELVACALPDINPKYSSLRGILNNCLTRIGSRTLRASILQPPCRVEEINARLDCVEALVNDQEKLTSLREKLGQLSKIDQILCLASVMPDSSTNCSARQLNYILILNTFFDLIHPLHDIFVDSTNTCFVELRETLTHSDFIYLKKIVRALIHENARPAAGEQGMTERCFAIKADINPILDLIRNRYSARLDELRDYVKKLGLEHNLDLKLSNNTRKGYHIVLKLAKQEIQRFKLSSLPEIFIHAERTVTMVTMTTIHIQTLQMRLEDISTEIVKISNVILYRLLVEIKKYIGIFYKLCEQIAKVDMIQALALSSSSVHKYVRPKFNCFMEIINGRHPLLEYLNHKDPIGNDVFASPEFNMNIVTGPNSSGKSIYIRQIVLLQIMAQVGCFVPADSATFRVADRILARIYLEDDMFCGASAFTMEMKEIQYFFNVMTPNTLIIIDELCRSTAVFEGTGLAMAICEKLAKTPAFIFFTTHYTFITKLYDMYYNIQCWQLKTEEVASETKKRVIYTHKVVPGVTDLEDYAIYSARTCWPSDVIKDVETIKKYIKVKQLNASVSRIDPKLRLKYNVEADLKILKYKGICTRDNVHKRVLMYQEDLMKMGVSIDWGNNLPSTSSSACAQQADLSFQQNIQPEAVYSENSQFESDENLENPYLDSDGGNENVLLPTESVTQIVDDPHRQQFIDNNTGRNEHIENQIPVNLHLEHFGEDITDNRTGNFVDNQTEPYFPYEFPEHFTKEQIVFREPTRQHFNDKYSEQYLSNHFVGEHSDDRNNEHNFCNIIGNNFEQSEQNLEHTKDGFISGQYLANQQQFTHNVGETLKDFFVEENTRQQFIDVQSGRSVNENTGQQMYDDYFRQQYILKNIENQQLTFEESQISNLQAIRNYDVNPHEYYSHQTLPRSKIPQSSSSHYYNDEVRSFNNENLISQGTNLNESSADDELQIPRCVTPEIIVIEHGDLSSAEEDFRSRIANADIQAERNQIELVDYENSLNYENAVEDSEIHLRKNEAGIGIEVNELDGESNNKQKQYFSEINRFYDNADVNVRDQINHQQGEECEGNKPPSGSEDAEMSRNDFANSTNQNYSENQRHRNYQHNNSSQDFEEGFRKKCNQYKNTNSEQKNVLLDGNQRKSFMGNQSTAENSSFTTVNEFQFAIPLNRNINKTSTPLVALKRTNPKCNLNISEKQNELGINKTMDSKLFENQNKSNTSNKQDTLDAISDAELSETMDCLESSGCLFENELSEKRKSVEIDSQNESISYSPDYEMLNRYKNNQKAIDKAIGSLDLTSASGCQARKNVLENADNSKLNVIKKKKLTTVKVLDVVKLNVQEGNSCNLEIESLNITERNQNKNYLKQQKSNQVDDSLQVLKTEEELNESSLRDSERKLVLEHEFESVRSILPQASVNYFKQVFKTDSTENKTKTLINKALGNSSSDSARNKSSNVIESNSSEGLGVSKNTHSDASKSDSSGDSKSKQAGVVKRKSSEALNSSESKKRSSMLNNISSNSHSRSIPNVTSNIGSTKSVTKNSSEYSTENEDSYLTAGMGVEENSSSQKICSRSGVSNNFGNDSSLNESYRSAKSNKQLEASYQMKSSSGNFLFKPNDKESCEKLRMDVKNIRNKNESSSDVNLRSEKDERLKFSSDEKERSFIQNIKSFENLDSSKSGLNFPMAFQFRSPFTNKANVSSSHGSQMRLNESTSSSSKLFENPNHSQRVKRFRKKPINKMTKKEIDRLYHERDLKFINSTGDQCIKYSEEILNRPKARQLKASKEVAVARKGNDGSVVVICDSGKQKSSKKENQPLRHNVGKTFDVTIFSDVNSHIFEEFMQTEQDPKRDSDFFNKVFRKKTETSTSDNASSNVNCEFFPGPSRVFPFD